MMEEIRQHFERLKNENYTRVVVRSGHLQERYYATFSSPEYTILKPNLTPEELDYCKTLGIA